MARALKLTLQGLLYKDKIIASLPGHLGLYVVKVWPGLWGGSQISSTGLTIYKGCMIVCERKEASWEP